MHCPDDLIAALASAPGGAMRAVIRVSGTHVVGCLGRCFSAHELERLELVSTPRAIRGHVTLDDQRRLPCDLYLWPDRRSFTRQPMAELHTVGSPPLVQAALRTICHSGARLAEPGEFTMRAFLAGRIDLPQAEAVLGVIDATSKRQFDTALAQLAGGISKPLTQLCDALLDLLADLEAGLDFVEDDIEFVSTDRICQVLDDCSLEMDKLQIQFSTRNVSQDLPQITLLGCTNVGKSSLLNVLASQDRALVSGMPGTTRDYVSSHVTINGIDCQVVDTAGISTVGVDNQIDEAAQNITSEQIQKACLQLLCLDVSRPLNTWEQAELRRDPIEPRIVVLTKTDLPFQMDAGVTGILTSSFTGAGIDQLRAEIATCLSTRASYEGSVVLGTAVRCRESLASATESVRHALQLARGDEGDELIATEIRFGLDELGKVVGAVYTDDILDRIFSRFCIGK